MPGDTGRGGAAPRQTRARAGASTGVQTRRAGGRDARVPAPAPDAEDIESDTRDREGAVVLPGGRVGASGNSSSNSDNDYQELDGGQTAQAEDVDPAEENIPQEEGGAAAANDRGAAGAVPETDIEQERRSSGGTGSRYKSPQPDRFGRRVRPARTCGGGRSTISSGK